MPEPTMQPMRSACSSLSASPVGRPASRTAWIDAARPKWMKVSMWRASLAGNVVLDLEALHLAGEAAGEGRRIEPA